MMKHQKYVVKCQGHTRKLIIKDMKLTAVGVSYVLPFHSDFSPFIYFFLLNSQITISVTYNIILLLTELLYLIKIHTVI